MQHYLWKFNVLVVGFPRLAVPHKFLGSKVLYYNGSQPIFPFAFAQLNLERSFLEDTLVTPIGFDNNFLGAASLKFELIIGWFHKFERSQLKMFVNCKFLSFGEVICEVYIC